MNAVLKRRRVEEAIERINKFRQKYGAKYSREDSAKIVRKMRDERTKHLLDVVEGRQ